MEENIDNIIYCNFFDFIKNNKVHIQKIKENYLDLMKNLTEVTNLSTNLFVSTLKEIEQMNGLIIIAYVGNLYSNSDSFKIVGSGTIIIEPKLIRGAKNVGHIEDIVVNPEYRGKQIAKNILSMLKVYGFSKNCYKIILDCDENLKHFYEKNDFEVKGIQMSKYF